MSLRARLTIGTACTLALAICVGFLAAYFVVRGQLRGEIDTSLKDRATAMASFTGRPSASRLRRLPRNVRISPPKLGGAAGYSQFVSAGGKISLPPNETIRLPAGGAAAVASGTGAAFYKDATVDGTHKLFLRGGASRWKAILSLSGDAAEVRGEEWYDLSSDPAERKSVAPAQAVADPIRRRALERWRTDRGAGGAAHPVCLSPEQQERLRALGYVSGGSAEGCRDER